MKKSRLVAAIAAAFISVGAFPARALATTISAYEFIEDVSGVNADTIQDLTRTRQIGADPAIVDTVDGTIIADNLVNASFGVFDSTDVTYTHLLSWLVPPAATYSYAKLTITAFDVNGQNDVVSADLVALGVLTAGNNVVTTTAFDDASLLLSIVDGALAVRIQKKGENSGVEGSINGLNVLSSRLDVRYDDTPEINESAVAAPEPATMLLVGTGLVAAARRRFRHRN